MTSKNLTPLVDGIIGDEVSTDASTGEIEIEITSTHSTPTNAQKDPNAKPGDASAEETPAKSGFNVGLFWKNPRTKSLLGRDHLIRGNEGGVSSWNKLFFLINEVVVHVLQYWVLKRGGGELFWQACSYYVFGETEESNLANYHVPEWQANAVLFASVLYTLKVMRWNFFVSHSNTVGVGTCIFVCLGYHTFAHISVSLACFRSWFAVRPGDDAATVARKEELAYFWACLGLAMCAGSLVLEAVADQQLAAFKANKSSNSGKSDKELADGQDKRVCDVGMWGWCRHPNYLWNVFPFASIGLISGCLPMFGLWVFIQVFWAYTQSAPNHEIYMAKRYGAEWDEYKKRVPMLIPKVPCLP